MTIVMLGIRRIEKCIAKLHKRIEEDVALKRRSENGIKSYNTLVII